MRHLSEKISIDKILESTANIVESIGRNSGSEYDNLTAAILEMNTNSILKEKMNKIAKIIITVLSVLLIGSIALNVSLLIDNGSENNVEAEETMELATVQAKYAGLQAKKGINKVIDGVKDLFGGKKDKK